MNKTETESFSIKQEKALSFLDRDFNQAFAQMRHYDSQILDLQKYLFTIISLVITISLGLYNYGIEAQVDLIPPAISIVAIGLLIGFIFLSTIIRTRVYFIRVTRYVNEQRQMFFNWAPKEFINKSKMYADPAKPQYYDWKSSHLWFTYVISILNGAMAGFLIYYIHIDWAVIIVSAIAAVMIQIIIVVCYLRSEENKAAEKADLGREIQNSESEIVS